MRQNQLETLKTQTQFDILVIGGGATGCGIAADAAARGLSVALVEKGDFAGGTSSRSTKLVHGGVRYLEAAIKHLDKVQYNLVKEGLHERGAFLRNAPHLARRLALVTPVYSWWELPYVFTGLKLYDILSGAMNIGKSTMISARTALKHFPTLRAEGLKGAVVYYDGQFNDIRMAISLILTAQQHGGVAVNYCAVESLTKDAAGRIDGAVIEDRLTGERFPVKAKTVVNACGPFAEAILRMDDPDAKPILKGAEGVHIILDRDKIPLDVGLLIPKTDDGRVLFLLPWERHIIVGTTDEPTEIVEKPVAPEADVAYLLDYVRRYFKTDVTEKDVKAAWCGIRPLVFDPKAKDTSQLAREHVIFESQSGLITIAGGKWTIYRLMAEHTVDRAVQVGRLNPPRGCVTHDMRLVGGCHFASDMDKVLAARHGLPVDVAENLAHCYGDQVGKILALITEHGMERLSPEHPFLEVEVLHAVREEQAVHVSDVLIRRLTFALTHTDAALAAVDRVVKLMADELGWDAARQEEERADAKTRVAAGL